MSQIYLPYMKRKHYTAILVFIFACYVIDIGCGQRVSSATKYSMENTNVSVQAGTGDTIVKAAGTAVAEHRTSAFQISSTTISSMAA